MNSFYIKDFLKHCGGELLSGRDSIAADAVSIDSRTIVKGSLFFAIKGENFDGHNFVLQAIEKGASGIVIENFENLEIIPSNVAVIKVKNTIKSLGLFAKAYRNSFKRIKIVAITGSNGKTTTKEMLYSIFSQKAKTIANKGNFNNQIGLPLSLFDLDSSYKYGIFEIGTSLFGEIDILGGILSPNAAAIVNIGYSHLETFESPAGVFKEKVNLFKYVGKKGLIVLNADDVFLSRVERDSFSKSLTFSISEEADIYASEISYDADGVSFKLHFGQEVEDIKICQIGAFFVQDAVCAAAIAAGFEFSLQDIKKGLESYTPPEMRMETFTLTSGAVFINDAYNANPSSMKESIRTVCETYPQKEITLVLGDMLELGVRSDFYHKEIGAFADSFKLKSVYLLGEEMLIAKDEFKRTPVRHFENQNGLLESLKRAMFNANSVVLFKSSRSMELEILINELKEIDRSGEQMTFDFE